MLKHTDDNSFANLTGFTRAAFGKLLRVLELPEEREARKVGTRKNKQEVSLHRLNTGM